MRKLSNVAYNTTTIQVERVAGGKAWNNPEYSTPTHANIGTTISNVLPSGSGWAMWPFGPGYSFGYTGSPVEPDWTAVATPNLRYANALRFSGFNITGTGVTGDCIVTNLHVYLQYKDLTNTFPNSNYKWNHSMRWLIQPVKSGGIPIIKKMFKSELWPSPFTPAATSRWTRHPCLKDQNHVTDTYADGIATNTMEFAQRSYNRVGDGWYSTQGFYGNDIDADYNEATSTITGLTIAEINDPNFYVDVWYGFAGVSGQSGEVTVYSMALEAEFIKPSTKTNIILYPRSTGNDATRSLSIPILNTRPWQSASLAGGTPDGISGEATPNVLAGNKDAYINFFSDPYTTYENRNNVSDNIIKFDTDYLTAKFGALDDMDDTQASVNDLILDIRFAAGNYNTTNDQGAGKVRWTYVLTDGYTTDHAATYGQPIWRNAILLTEPGIRTLWNGPGYSWQRIGDGYLLAIDEVHPRDQVGGAHGDKWITKHWPLRLNLGGSGTTPGIQNWGTSMANTGTYPGSVYDPLWVEKALKAGNFYFNLILTLDPGTAQYWNMNPYPTMWFRVDNLSIRVNYNTVGGPPTSADAGLLYRFTP